MSATCVDEMWCGRCAGTSCNGDKSSFRKMRDSLVGSCVCRSLLEFPAGRMTATDTDTQRKQWKSSCPNVNKLARHLLGDKIDKMYAGRCQNPRKYGTIRRLAQEVRKQVQATSRLTWSARKVVECTRTQRRLHTQRLRPRNSFQHSEFAPC